MGVVKTFYCMLWEDGLESPGKEWCFWESRFGGVYGCVLLECEDVQLRGSKRDGYRKTNQDFHLSIVLGTRIQMLPVLTSTFP